MHSKENVTWMISFFNDINLFVAVLSSIRLQYNNGWGRESLYRGICITMHAGRRTGGAGNYQRWLQHHPVVRIHPESRPLLRKGPRITAISYTECTTHRWPVEKNDKFKGSYLICCYVYLWSHLLSTFIALDLFLSQWSSFLFLFLYILVGLVLYYVWE